MPQFTVSAGNSFAYEHIPPSDGGVTFCCFNALSGDRGMWQQAIGAAVQAAGHGLLIWNFRGQPETAFTFSETSEQTIVSDALALLEAEQPKRPVHVGLSIGGLFAMRAHLNGGGGRANGLVLLNTLRKAGPRLDWINHAVVRMAETGGMAMMKDFYMPLLMNQDWQSQNRAQFFKEPYAPMPADDGTVMLLKSGISAGWDVAYEDLGVPVLSITGQQDRVFRNEADIDELSARISNLTRLEFQDAGHMIPVEQPGALGEALVAFAAKL